MEDPDPTDWIILEATLIDRYEANWKDEYESAIIELEEYDKSTVFLVQLKKQMF